MDISQFLARVVVGAAADWMSVDAPRNVLKDLNGANERPMIHPHADHVPLPTML
jgi:hypothetical protein